MRQLWTRRASDGRISRGRSSSEVVPRRNSVPSFGTASEGLQSGVQVQDDRTREAPRHVATYPVGLRTEWAELAGSCVAQNFEVKFMECRRRPGVMIARVAPSSQGFDCPITGDTMRVPVMMCDGHVYDRAAIERWFSQGRQTSPLTNLDLPSLGCMPLMPLRKAIETFLNRRPEVMDFRANEVQALESTIATLREELQETQAALGVSRRVGMELERRLEEEQHARRTPSPEKVHCEPPLLPSQRLGAALRKAQDPKHAGVESKRLLKEEMIACARVAEQEAAELHEATKMSREILGLDCSDVMAGKGKTISVGAQERYAERRQQRTVIQARQVLVGRRSISPPSCEARPRPKATVCRNSAKGSASAPPRRKTMGTLQLEGSSMFRGSGCTDSSSSSSGDGGSSSSSSSSVSEVSRLTSRQQDVSEERNAAAREQTQRTDLITALFRVLTSRGAQQLRFQHLRNFAHACGFQGSDLEWLAEYEAICLEYGSTPEAGLHYEHFERFLEDPDGSAHCSNEELAGLLAQLEGDNASTSATFGASTSELPPSSRCIWSASGWDGWPVCLPARTAEQSGCPGLSPRSQNETALLSAAGGA